MSVMEDVEYKDKGRLKPFLKRMFSYTLKYPQWFWRFAAFMVVVAAVDAAFPFIWSKYIDLAVVPAITGAKTGGIESVDDSVFWWFAAIYVAVAMAQIVGVRLFIKYAGLIEEHVMADLRSGLFRKLQELTYSYYDKNAQGWLLSRITSDTGRVTEVVSWGLVEAIWGIVNIVISLVLLFTCSVELGLIVAVSLPVLFFVSVRIRMLILRYSRKARKLNSEMTANYNEHIDGVAVNKSTSQEHRVISEFDELSGQMKWASYKASYYTAMYMPLVIFLGAIVAVIVMGRAGALEISGDPEMTVGVFAMAVMYATNVFIPIFDISVFYAMAQGAISAGERIFTLLDEEPEIEDSPDAKQFDSIRGDVEFENVTFQYSAEKTVLHDVSFSVPAGKTVALVGDTGGGKSTIVRLIGRYYDIHSGRVLIDGIDIRDRTRSSLRKQMGVVLQTPHVFSGTIRDNIAYGNNSCTEERIHEVLRLAGAEDMIARLSERVGESGDGLSSGEKQLISIARALLVDPRILIMDEATSSVDTLTEARIQQGIANIVKGRTAFIIAHRLSTIRNADIIMVVRKGEIIEKGTHASLMASKGVYHRLYTLQLQDESTEQALNTVGSAT